jgi:hypothetical protein
VAKPTAKPVAKPAATPVAKVAKVAKKEVKKVVVPVPATKEVKKKDNFEVTVAPIVIESVNDAVSVTAIDNKVTVTSTATPVAVVVEKKIKKDSTPKAKKEKVVKEIPTEKEAEIAPVIEPIIAPIVEAEITPIVEAVIESIIDEVVEAASVEGLEIVIEGQTTNEVMANLMIEEPVAQAEHHHTHVHVEAPLSPAQDRLNNLCINLEKSIIGRGKPIHTHTFVQAVQGQYREYENARVSYNRGVESCEIIIHAQGVSQSFTLPSRLVQ